MVLEQKISEKNYRWLLFFYSVPSKPVSNRMSVWRKLMKAGAVSLKGAVYILPFTPEHYEFLQWLVTEIKAMNGDAAVVSIEKVDTIKDSEIVDLFNQTRRSDYLAIRQDLDGLGRKLSNIKKGGQGQNLKGLSGQLDKIFKAFAEIQRIDFFLSAEGVQLRASLDLMHNELNQLSGTPKKTEKTAVVSQKLASDYQGRVWATRKRPFVDRMACAWLIKHFIDKDAVFEFVDENKIDALPATTIVFDIYGGEFTHVGDLCTFEVLIKTFGFKDKALKLIAETVHDLDMKDAKYQAPEAMGVEHILAGIRKSASEDSVALALGMQVFEMLYVSKKS
ncbi:MAG: chromate resistance protein [Deltaproteobacteria bacterium]|nr:chromate resistance protein [Deltaproteobacteria bacterium]